MIGLSSKIPVTQEKIKPLGNNNMKPGKPEVLHSRYEFPIQSNRLNVNCISMITNATHEEVVVLKNAASADSSVSLSIKDCDDFYFKNGKQSQEVTISPGASQPIGILFNSKIPGLKQEVLTIRVHGFRNKYGKAVKSTLQLHGFAGQPLIKVLNDIQVIKDNNFNMTLYELNNDTTTVKDVEFINQGNAEGFLHVETFLDSNLKTKSDWMTGSIHLDKNKFTVTEGQIEKLTFRIDPELISWYTCPFLVLKFDEENNAIA